MQTQPNFTTEFLREAGYKLTGNRLSVAAYLDNNKGIFCANDLLRSISNIDKVSLYRTLELFRKLDIIHPVVTLDGEQYYEAHEHSDHHHHAICTKCHKSECISCDYTDKPVPGFKETHHAVAVTGICYKCS